MGRRLRAITERVRATLRGKTPPRVLCVDDDPNVRALCAAAASRAGFEPHEAANGREALDKLKESNYAAVLLDLGMPSLHGSTVISVLQRERPDILSRTIVLTGAPDAALVDVIPLVRAVAKKPVSNDTLRYLLERCSAEADA